MAKTDLTKQRQKFVDEYVHSEDHLKAAKKVLFRPIPVIENFLATFIKPLCIGTEFAGYPFITLRI